MRDILEKFLPSKKTIFKILQRDYEGENWENAKTYEAYDARDAAEMYADDYRDEQSGEWNDDTEIFLNVKHEDEIERIAVSFQYTPLYYVREMDEDEE